MSEFIFMLTKNDATIDNAIEVYKEIRDLQLNYVGFKDIGLPFEKLKRLTETIHEGGQSVMIEVVSETRDNELRSVEASLSLGVDYLIGGTHADEVTSMIKGSDMLYYPFPGKIVGHPSLLRGTTEEIVESAKNLERTSGVVGLDLLAYRFDGNVPDLVEKVVKAVNIPVIAAGSVDSIERIRTLSSLGVWGFTVGSAIFDGKFGSQSVRAQIEAILEASV